MPDGGEQQALRYSAFISYSHEDIAFASSLHRRLENYRFPRRLARGQDPRSPGSRRLRPVCRDRARLAAAPNLTAAIRQGIAESSALIVVCSRNAVSSQWVSLEIELFRQIHADSPILAALAADTPATSFPPALLSVGPDGRPLQPLAADFRQQGDGPRLALLKLVAVLADVRLDELVQWDAQHRIRTITIISAAALLGMAVMSTLALAAVNASKMAEAERARGAGLVDSLISSVRAKLKEVGRLDVSEAVNQAAIKYFRGENPAKLPVSTLLQGAALLQEIGEDDLASNDLAQAHAQFDAAMATTTRLLRAHLKDRECIYAQAQSEFWVGRIDWREGDHVGADLHFRAYAGLANRLTRMDPSKPRWLMEAGFSNSNLGTLVFRWHGDLLGADAYFQAALGALEIASRSDPNDSYMQIQVADGYRWLADVERHRGRFDTANADVTADRRILDMLLARNPRSAEIRADIVADKMALGRIDIDRGAMGEAIGKLNEGHLAALELVQGDPKDMSMAGELRMFDLFEARTWMVMRSRRMPVAADAVDQKLGSCSDDLNRLGSEEIATFCSILQARWLAQLGDVDGARAILKKVDVGKVSHGEKLSPRWGLDFDEELSEVFASTTEQATH